MADLQKILQNFPLDPVNWQSVVRRQSLLPIRSFHFCFCVLITDFRQNKRVRAEGGREWGRERERQRARIKDLAKQQEKCVSNANFVFLFFASFDTRLSHLCFYLANSLLSSIFFWVGGSGGVAWLFICLAIAEDLNLSHRRSHSLTKFGLFRWIIEFFT